MSTYFDETFALRRSPPTKFLEEFHCKALCSSGPIEKKKPKEYKLTPGQYDFIFRELGRTVAGGLTQEDADRMRVNMFVLDTPSRSLVNCRCYIRKKVYHIYFEDANLARELLDG
jgi:hypothetical protein